MRATAIGTLARPVGSRRARLTALATIAASLALPAAAAAAPPNDNFASSAMIGGFPATVNGTNVEATAEPGEPVHGTASSGQSVWYFWVAPETSSVTIEVCPTAPFFNFTAAVGIYTGDTVATLSPVARDFQATRCPGGSIQAWTFQATGGQTYRFAVDGQETPPDPGAFVLTVNRPPGNDNFGEAFDLPGLPAESTGSNFGATEEPGEPNHAGMSDGQSVWWQWTAPVSGPVAAELCTVELIPAMAVYTGSSVGALSEIARIGERFGPSCAQLGWRADFRATAGQIYRIAVASREFYGHDSGTDLLMKLLPVPPNDDFAFATPMAGSFASVLGQTNAGASREQNEPNIPAGAALGRSVWYSWTAPASGPTSVDTCDGSFDTLVGVFTGTGLLNLREVASDDDSCVREGGSFAEFTAQAGTSYKIVVDGYQREAGIFDLYIEQVGTPPPPPQPGPAPRPSPPAPGPSPPQPPPAKGATAGNDQLRGTAGADRICGLAGSDTIDGLDGADALFGDQCAGGAPGLARQARAMAAGDGNDTLNGGPGNDRLAGSGGADRLNGDAGNDKLDGGKGKDALNAGAGADNVRAQDGARDRVNCGGGHDKVSADRIDKLKGCERVRRR